jgi:hypothetical protein
MVMGLVLACGLMLGYYVQQTYYSRSSASINWISACQWIEPRRLLRSLFQKGGVS